MTPGTRFWTCGECGQSLPADTIDLPGTPAAEDLAHLPSLLALPLREFAAERHLVMRLHRLCDAVEILTRFCVLVALGELRARLGDQPLPDGLLDDLQPQIERPTFGQWKVMLRALLGALPRDNLLVLPQLRDFARTFLLPLLPGGQALPEQCVIKLRNDLAHGGAMTQALARDYLQLWGPRLQELTARLAFLAAVDVCFLAEDGPRRLLGPSQSAQPRPLAADLQQALRPLVGHVILLHECRWLDLWPLCDYGPAVTSTLKGPRRSSTDGPMVYMRAERDRLLYAVLGGDLPRSERPDVRAEFNDLFRLEKRVLRPADQAPDFETEILSDSLSLVGRGREALVEQFKIRIESAAVGVFWLTGPGGIGKSFALARLATELAHDPWRCRIAWRFKASDAARCNRFAFYRHALARLLAWPWLEGRDVGPLLDPNALEGQLDELLDAVAQLPADAATGRSPQVVFVLDGLDEIDRQDPSFAGVPFRLARPRVLWVCSGRAERTLPQVFSPERCTHLVAGGLLPMSDDDIRAMLLEGSDALKYQLLLLDIEETRDGRVRVVNAAVEAVVRRAAGLPLYVRLVVQDIVSGHFTFADLHERLPAKLEEYYDDLLRRMALGELHALLTPLLVTIAWGQVPLEEGTLQLLMVRRKVLVDGNEGRQALLKGLRALESMLRTAPLPDSGHGFEPYHLTFRGHICEDRARIIGMQNALARNEFCDLARDWNTLPAYHAARRYLARHGLAHCRETDRPEDALRLAVQVAEAGDWDYLADLVESMQQLRQAGPNLVERILARLKEEANYGARLVRVLYQLWRMPTTIAFASASTYAAEQHAALRCYRLMDLIENAIRFSGILAAADLLHHPAAAALGTASSGLDRPTLGRWAGFQRTYYRWCAEHDVQPSFLALGEMLAGSQGPHREELEGELIGFRNRLVHGGRLGAAEAEQHLRWLMGKAEEYFEVMAALAEGQLLVLREQLQGRHGLFQIFCGPRPRSTERTELPCPAGARPGDVFFSLGNSGLIGLAPLVVTEAAAHADVPLLVYLRRQGPDELVYLRIGSDEMVRRHDTAAIQSLRRLLGTAANEEAGEQVNWEDEFRREAASFVGRAQEISHVKGCLKAAPGGVFWIGGPGGIGKSAVMASLAEDFGRDPRKVCRIAWRFASRDPKRGNGTAFFRHAIAKLAARLGKPELPAAADAREQLAQLRALLDEATNLPAGEPGARPPRVLFLLDDMDELALVDPEFLEVPFRLGEANVIWLCAGRPQGRLLEVFALDRCVHLFPDGLPPMSEADIRAMLVDETGGLKYQLLRLDRDPSTLATPEQSGPANAALEAIITRGQGLPLYVRLVAEDIVAGQLQFGELSAKLPRGLSDYYDNMLGRFAIGEQQSLLTPLVVSVVWAKAPLDEETLLELLMRRSLLPRDEASLGLLQEVLKAAQMWLRKVPLGDGRSGYAPYHLAFRDHVRADSQGTVTLQNRLARREFCRLALEWNSLPREHPARWYALRHGPEHLLDETEYAELDGLARTPAFLQAQADELPAEPIAPLLTLQAALRGAMIRDDAVAMVEFSLRHARRALTILQESPLQALCQGGSGSTAGRIALQRALQLADLAGDGTEPQYRVAWYLLLVWELETLGRAEEAQAIVQRLFQGEPPRLAGWMAGLVTTVLDQSEALRKAELGERNWLLLEQLAPLSTAELLAQAGRIFEGLSAARSLADHAQRVQVLGSVGLAQAQTGDLRGARETFVEALQAGIRQRLLEASEQGGVAENREELRSLLLRVACHPSGVRYALAHLVRLYPEQAAAIQEALRSEGADDG
jgi:hypothetical protein